MNQESRLTQRLSEAQDSNSPKIEGWDVAKFVAIISFPFFFVIGWILGDYLFK